MSAPLRPEILPPTPSGHFFRTVLLCNLLALVAISLWSARHLHARVGQEATSVAARTSNATSELLFVFRAGGATYVRLADVASDRIPAHGKLRFFDDNDGTAVIATIGDRDMPARYRRYRGARLRIDRDCEANVRGFAIVARLLGDPGYAGLEDPAWTTASVMQHGVKMLAAQIDGCETGTFARDATHSKLVVPVEISNDALVDVARSTLLASDVAADTQVAWQSAAMPGRWHDHVDLDAKVLRHPTTGTTWVIVHATYPEIDCANPDVNFMGLFAVARDGALETVTIRKLDRVYSIDTIVDADGDGDLELVGRSWFGLETILVDAKDERELDRLRFPFFACAC